MKSWYRPTYIYNIDQVKIPVTWILWVIKVGWMIYTCLSPPFRLALGGVWPSQVHFGRKSVWAFAAAREHTEVASPFG